MVIRGQNLVEKMRLKEDDPLITGEDDAFRAPFDEDV